MSKPKKPVDPQEINAAGISRRSFIKGAAAGALGIATAGIMSACSPTEAPAVANTPAPPAADSTPTVTPAPEAPKADTGWLGAEPVISEGDITESIDTEVLIIGSGHGGLFAACAAAEEGAKVLVINKLAVCTGLRDDIGAVNSKMQQAEGMAMEKHELVREIAKYSAHRADSRLHYLWAKKSGEAVDWYAERLNEVGVKLWNEAGYGNPKSNYKHYPTGHSPEWPMDGSLNGGIVLTNYAKSLGVTIRNECPMIKLVKEGEKVTGAIAQDLTDKHYVKINASKGVIVATGGYASNRDMLEALSPETLKATSSHVGCIPGTTGDGIKACLWAGAEQDDVHTLMVFDRAAIKPNTEASPDTEGRFFWIGSQPLLKVDVTGKRFFNESGCYDFATHAATMVKGNSYFTIWDENLEANVHQMETQGCSRMYNHENGAPPDIPFFVVKGMLEGLMEEGFVIRADTIEELAKALGLPADEFSATVGHYNELCKNGDDVDFGKESYRLTPVNTAPYYGARNCAYILCTIDGIRINENMQALNSNKEPIEGLYVVGNDAGGFFAHTYPNLFTGLCAGRISAFSRLAGQLVAKR